MVGFQEGEDINVSDPTNLAFNSSAAVLCSPSPSFLTFFDHNTIAQISIAVFVYHGEVLWLPLLQVIPNDLSQRDFSIYQKA
jgi:hypothetical protein